MLENFYVQVVRDNHNNEVVSFDTTQEVQDFLQNNRTAFLVNANTLVQAWTQYQAQENSNYSFEYYLV